MTEEHIKELLSVGFIQLLANRHGFTVSKAQQDYGCDMVLNEVSTLDRNGKKRLVETGKKLDLQLKSTVERQVHFHNGNLKFDLETKTFNDLIFRRNDIVPLFLVVMVLPDDPTNWLTLTPAEMIIRKSAYWYLPEVGTSFSDNQTTTRITIPLNNIIGPTFVADRLAEVYQ